MMTTYKLVGSDDLDLENSVPAEISLFLVSWFRQRIENLEIARIEKLIQRIGLRHWKNNQNYFYIFELQLLREL